MRAVAEADGDQRLGGPGAALPDAGTGVEQAVGDVVQYGGVLGEEELLEHEPDAGGAQRGQFPVAQRRDVQPVDAHPSRGGSVQRAQQLQQRGLAGAGRADDRDQFAPRDREVHPGQRGDRRLPGVRLGHLLDLEYHAHEAGTTTCCPSDRPEPVTCTSPDESSNSPGVTGTR